MLTNFKSIGKRVIFCIFSLKNSAWRAAWILALALGHPVSHGIASAALPVAVSNTTIPSLAPLLKEVTPAVVNISVLAKSALKMTHFFAIRSSVVFSMCRKRASRKSAPVPA